MTKSAGVTSSNPLCSSGIKSHLKAEFAGAYKALGARGGVWGGVVSSALTAPRAGAVDQALVPGGGQGLNCNPEGDVHQKAPASRIDGAAENLITISLTATRGDQ